MVVKKENSGREMVYPKGALTDDGKKVIVKVHRNSVDAKLGEFPSGEVMSDPKSPTGQAIRADEVTLVIDREEYEEKIGSRRKPYERMNKRLEDGKPPVNIQHAHAQFVFNREKGGNPNE